MKKIGIIIILVIAIVFTALYLRPESELLEAKNESEVISVDLSDEAAQEIIEVNEHINEYDYIIYQQRMIDGSSKEFAQKLLSEECEGKYGFWWAERIDVCTVTDNHVTTYVDQVVDPYALLMPEDSGEDGWMNYADFLQPEETLPVNGFVTRDTVTATSYKWMIGTKPYKDGIIEISFSWGNPTFQYYWIEADIETEQSEEAMLEIFDDAVDHWHRRWLMWMESAEFLNIDDQRCLDLLSAPDTDDTWVDTLDCANELYDVTDRVLNGVYQSLLYKLPQQYAFNQSLNDDLSEQEGFEEVETLRQLQREWIIERDDACQMEGTVRLMCWAAITQDRVAWLEKYKEDSR